jgi:ABC-type branched-subunit amino acid transport system substrate-binding protein
VDYPAAQALAAGILAERALGVAGTTDPAAIWDAARALRASTFLGPFAIDEEGRQTAHAPAIVRWEPGSRGPVRRVVWRPPTTA